MIFDRFAAKHQARESMRLNNPSPILVTLVYFILTSLLSAGISYLLYNPIGDLLWCFQAGYEVEEILEFVLTNHQKELLLLVIVQLLYNLYATFMSFGYTSYTLHMARNEQPGMKHLFDGFARPFRVLWANILVDFFTFLWALAVIIPLTLLVVLAGLDTLNSVSVVVPVGVITMIVVNYRYRLTTYFLVDDPTCTARQALKRSKNAMKGQKWSLFSLHFSFFGWILLSAVLSSLLSWFLPVTINDVLCFWVLPYRCASEANFYDAVTGPGQPSDSTAGPNYDYQAKDGTQPF